MYILQHKLMAKQNILKVMEAGKKNEFKPIEVAL
jgi:hypothetical protein